jgi:hypothetical protein
MNERLSFLADHFSMKWSAIVVVQCVHRWNRILWILVYLYTWHEVVQSEFVAFGWVLIEVYLFATFDLGKDNHSHIFSRSKYHKRVSNGWKAENFGLSHVWVGRLVWAAVRSKKNYVLLICHVNSYFVATIFCYRGILTSMLCQSSSIKYDLILS